MNTCAITTRWLMRADLSAVCQLAAMAGSSLRDPKRVETTMKQPGVNAQVVVLKSGDGRAAIVGYSISRLIKDRIELWELYVDPKFRRRGYARALLEKSTKRLGDGTFRKVLALVKETDVQSCNFLKHLGFKSTLVRNAYGSVDGVEFCFHVNQQERAACD